MIIIPGRNKVITKVLEIRNHEMCNGIKIPKRLTFKNNRKDRNSVDVILFIEENHLIYWNYSMNVFPDRKLS